MRPLNLTRGLAALAATCLLSGIGIGLGLGWHAHGWKMRAEQREIDTTQETTQRNLRFAQRLADETAEELREARAAYRVADRCRREAERWVAETRTRK